MPPFKKGEAITDPIVLERLSKAREKAVETRKAKAQAKRDEKLVTQIEEKKKRQATQDKLKELIEQPKEEPPTYEEATKEEPKPNLKKSPTKQDLQKEDEPEEDVEIEYMKVPKKKPAKKKKIVYVEESDEEPEEEVRYVKKPSKEKFITEERVKQMQPPNQLDLLYQRYYGNM